MVSAAVSQFLARVSLPLLQIILGAAVSFLITVNTDSVFSDTEFFMLFFIAPLLYYEAKELSYRQLWEIRASLIILAAVLVAVTVFVLGLLLKLTEPNISFAAACALGAALGPTDAVAVTALSKDISLTKRQNLILGGEAMINDASGVVAFKFAIGAALTGTFSLSGAAVAFAAEFFGGIALGAFLMTVFKACMRHLRALGLQNPSLYVLFEICIPFIVYSAAQYFSVSGILAVIAARLVPRSRMRGLNPQSSRYLIIGHATWQMIVFTLNGVLFVLFGIQLAGILRHWDVAGTPLRIVGLILLLTCGMYAVRYLFVLGLELFRFLRTAKTAPKRKNAPALRLKVPLRSALVLTLAGSKGAMTLVIVLTIPFFLSSGELFAYRSLLILVASGVIVISLLLANFLVPVIVPKAEKTPQDARFNRVRIEILQSVMDNLEKDRGRNPDAPTELALQAYRERQKLLRGRHIPNSMLRALQLRILEKQIDYVRSELREKRIEGKIGGYYISALYHMAGVLKSRRVRKTLGVLPESIQKIPAVWRVRTFFIRLRIGIPGAGEREALHKLHLRAEGRAIEFLNEIIGQSGDAMGRKAAALMMREIRARLAVTDFTGEVHLPGTPAHPRGFSFSHMGRKGHDGYGRQKHLSALLREKEAEALADELEQIAIARERGKLTAAQARELREEVYLLQLGLGG